MKDPTAKSFECGGYTPGSATDLDISSSGVSIEWKVHIPNKALRCRISISDGITQFLIIKGIGGEESFITVFPVDGTADKEGFFSCGKKTDGLENKFVSIPRGLQSPQQILRLSWTLDGSTENSCSDVKIPQQWIAVCSKPTTDNAKACEKIFSGKYLQGKFD